MSTHQSFGAASLTYSSKRCRFLELPEELRMAIYEYLFPLYQLSLAPEYDPVDDDEASPFEDLRFFARNRAGHLYPSIIQTCNLIYTEAQPLLYRPACVALLPLERAKYFRVHDRVFPISNLSYFKKLSELHIQLDMTFNTAYYDSFFSRLLSEALGPSVHVDMLVFSLSISINFWRDSFYRKLTSGTVCTLLENLVVSKCNLFYRDDRRLTGNVRLDWYRDSEQDWHAAWRKEQGKSKLEYLVANQSTHTACRYTIGQASRVQ